MKKFYYFSVFTLMVLFFHLNTYAQVGINTTTPRGALDVASSTMGVVIPTVALSATNVQTAINPQGGTIPAGTVVYNSISAGVSPNDVGPGLYYWNGSRWIAFAGSPGGMDWSLQGNSGTNNGTDFLGTTDSQPLVIKVNNIERIRMGTTETIVNEDAQSYNFRVEGISEPELFFVDALNNHVHIRDTSPWPEIDMFTAVGNTNDYAINAYASGQDNAAVYGRHETFATGSNTSVAAGFDGGGYGYPTIDGYTFGASIGGHQTGALVSSNALSGNRWGLITRNTYNDGSPEGVVGSEARLAGYSTGYGEGGFSGYYGGYFDGNMSTRDYAFVGIRYNSTNYKILGGGTVSTIVDDLEEKKRIMFAPEAPEILFEDYGSGKLLNGETYIKIDPIFSKNIVVNEKHPLRVFIQLEGQCNGVYVSNKTAQGFRVKELENGVSNVPFSWHIVAVRIDSKDSEGNIDSKHEGVRFPYGPEKLEPLKYNKEKMSKRK